MKTVLHELSLLPGVIGSCVSVDDDILASSLPVSFNKGMATDAASSIRRMIQMGKIKGLTPANMSICYDKFTVLAIPVTDTSLLLILCGQGNNTSLVATTASILAPEIEKKLTRPQQKEIAIPDPVPPQKTKQINPKTSKALEQIKTALFETVGPIADMIYKDCFLDWTKNYPANTEHILELLACISKEIANDDFFEKLKNKIAPLL